MRRNPYWPLVYSVPKSFVVFFCGRTTDVGSGLDSAARMVPPAIFLRTPIFKMVPDIRVIQQLTGYTGRITHEQFANHLFPGRDIGHRSSGRSSPTRIEERCLAPSQDISGSVRYRCCGRSLPWGRLGCTCVSTCSLQTLR